MLPSNMLLLLPFGVGFVVVAAVVVADIVAYWTIWPVAMTGEYVEYESMDLMRPTADTCNVLRFPLVNVTTYDSMSVIV